MKTLSFQLDIKDPTAYAAALEREAQSKTEQSGRKPSLGEAVAASAEAIAYGFRNFGLDASASDNFVHVECKDKDVQDVRTAVRTQVCLLNGLEIDEVQSFA